MKRLAIVFLFITNTFIKTQKLNKRGSKQCLHRRPNCHGKKALKFYSCNKGLSSKSKKQEKKKK